MYRLMNNRLSRVIGFLLILVSVSRTGISSPASAQDIIPSDPPLRWWKGNTHTHSLWSDGNDFPEMIAEWYRTHGYNFLVLSDHNVLSQGIRWMKVSSIIKRGGAEFGEKVVPKYLDRFGDHWVQTRGTPGTDDYEVRLKPLNEFRSLVEQRGEFIMMSGEEISDEAAGMPVHMNVANVHKVIKPLGGRTAREAMAANLRAVLAQEEKTGREMFVHLNHPNFHYAVTAEDLAAVLMERFLEVYNGHPAVHHGGDGSHPSTERMWDIANTIRVAQARTAPLFGMATDDSHEYHKPTSSRLSQSGRGWIMVRARHLTPESLVRAIKRGDFYASSGVRLREIRFDDQDQTLQLEIEPELGVTYSTQFIGTLVGYDPTSSEVVVEEEEEDGEEDAKDKVDSPAEREAPPAPITRHYSEDVGMVLAVVEGDRPVYYLSGQEYYVRAVVTSNKPPPNPSFSGPFEQAWTQPVGWEEWLGPSSDLDISN